MACYMVRGGFSEETAFGCDDDFRIAAMVTLAGFEGNKFDWQTMSWIERG